MNKIILLIAILISISFRVKATAIIVIIYPDKIVLGVDSRLVYTDNKTGEKKYKSGCKLSIVNNFAFAFTGYRGYTGNIAAAYKNFNTDLYVRSVLQKHTISLHQTFSELVEGLDKELTNQMRTLRQLNFKDYLQYLKNYNGNFINLVVIGNDKGVPFAFALNAILTEVNGMATVKAEASVFKNKTTIIHTGQTDAVAKYIKMYPALLQKERPVSLIDKLMTLTIKDKPLDVGLPVDIAEITGTSGLRWIRKKSGCPL